jgi:hypothetical protein
MNKREKVKNIYIKNKSTTDRNALVNTIMKSVDVTKGTAQTYLSLAIKEHAISQGDKYVGRDIKTDSLKREQARKIFNANPQMSRKELVGTFMEQFDMTKQSASTHCTMFSKSLMESETPHKALESVRCRKS